MAIIFALLALFGIATNHNQTSVGNADKVSKVSTAGKVKMHDFHF